MKIYQLEQNFHATESENVNKAAIQLIKICHISTINFDLINNFRIFQQNGSFFNENKIGKFVLQYILV